MYKEELFFFSFIPQSNNLIVPYFYHHNILYKSVTMVIG